jgi:cellulose synthase/poly-beta-1,6-N-acetylglucosamine synthase-like glycosyltransferase
LVVQNSSEFEPERGTTSSRSVHYNRTRDEDASVNDAGDGNSGDGDPAAGDAPEISIITPCYNAVRHLRDAIESVAGQRGVRIEHIVVDAGSQDGTVEILKQFGQVRWISEPDRGQADAFNKIGRAHV